VKLALFFLAVCLILVARSARPSRWEWVWLGLAFAVMFFSIGMFDL
jgi:threonine/homoserine/homoserine lactone efflux protein